jgi:hypothetical protein
VDASYYFKMIDRLATVCADDESSPQDLIEQADKMSDAINECIAFCVDMIDAPEDHKYKSYLESGYFQEKPKVERLAAFDLCFEIQYALDALDLRRQCEAYTEDQALFSNAPDLFDRIRKKKEHKKDFELIDLNALKFVTDSEICMTEKGYMRLVRFLKPQIVNWAKSQFSKAPIYVRLDPHFFSKEKPAVNLLETTLVPADPKWLPKLSLHKGMKDYAEYVLEDMAFKEDPIQYREYNLRCIRRLEVRAERLNDNRLTMMIEELPRPDNPNRLMVGRCIHLDTFNPPGTPWYEAKFAHFDMAINVYEGKCRKVRFDQRIKDGKVEDASYRTHLFRIECVPINSLFIFSLLFLKSSILLKEWFQEFTGNFTGHEERATRN